jgi:hypothetical protein
MMNLAMSVVMAGANFWDAATHVMSGSNDLPTRRRIFEWIEKHEKTLYEPRSPVDPIGVYFSPATRNYFPDDFVRSFQGVVILLLQAHRELQIVTPRTLASFRGSALILPNVRVLDDEERAAVGAEVSRGTRLIVTGADATGLSSSSAVRFAECPGRAYLARLEKDFERTKPSTAAAVMNALPDQEIRVAAPSSVVADIAQVGGKLHIFLANFDGLVGGQNAVQTPQKDIRVSIPAAGSAKAWFLPFLGEAVELEGQRQKEELVFVLPEIQKGAVVWFERAIQPR